MNDQLKAYNLLTSLSLRHRSNSLISLAFPAIIVVILISYPVESLGQVKNDFIISDSGGHPSIAYDLKNGIYVSWDNLNDAIHLVHLDSLGIQLEYPESFENTYASFFPRVAVGRALSVIVWKDRLSNYINFFKTYIIGSILAGDSAVVVDTLMFNNHPVDDAIRSDPDVSFINDTLFVVVWDGNGDSTRSPQSGVYGQIVSTFGNKIGDNFLITDHIKNATNSSRPRIICKQGNNFFIVIWEDNSSGHPSLYGRTFDFTGVPLDSSFLISDDNTITNLFYYSVALDTSGNFVTAWIADKGNKSQIEWRWYQSNGIPLMGVEALTSLDTLFNSGNSIDISIDEQNRIVVEWEQNTSIKFVSKIYGKCYLSDKTPFGNAFKVSTNNLPNSYEIYPNVTLRNGRIFTVWQTDTSGIMGRIMDFDSISLVVRNEQPIINPARTYSLYQNYPNPFNPTTVISYQLPVNTFVTLKVYDELGRQVKTLIEERQNAGSHSVTFNADNLSSGVFFYTLTAESFVETRKLIFIK
jgi:hypothetical protein